MAELIPVSVRMAMNLFTGHAGAQRGHIIQCVDRCRADGPSAVFRVSFVEMGVGRLELGGNK